MKTVTSIIVAIMLLLLHISCSKEEPVQAQIPEPTPLLGTNWKLQSIEFTYSDILVDPSGWKEYIVNSGMVTTIGEVTLNMTNSSFSFVVELDNSYSQLFGLSTLLGVCTGSLLIGNDLLTFNSESSLGIFELGRDEQEAYANYDIQGEKLSLSLIIPVYLKISTPPYYVKVGDEFYNCKFNKHN